MSRRESWVRSYAAPFAIRVALWQTACAIALLVAAGVVSMVSADAIAHTVAAGSALVAAVVLLAAVIGAVLNDALAGPPRDRGGHVGEPSASCSWRRGSPIANHARWMSPSTIS